MRRNKRDFGRLILIAIFLFVAVLLPNLINAISRAAGTLGTFAAGETGIKLCATISGGNEDALRFNVTNNQGFQADVVVPADTCKNIHTEAATYHVRQYVSQEYAIDSVSGGTISADDTDFVATASGQYSIVYANSYSQKPYLHNFGYTSSATVSSAVEVTFDANSGTGTMAPQYFGLNAQRTLTANTFPKAGYAFDGWNTDAAGTGTSYVDEQALTFASGGELKLYAQWTPTNVVADILIREEPTTYDVDFTRKAIVSNDPYQENGNGVREYTEGGEEVRYYRGEVFNNNIIWGGYCWKMLRSTATGGTKLIYNGEPTLVNGAQQCLATGAGAQITYNNTDTFQFNSRAGSGTISPADAGYMFGARIRVKSIPHDTAASYTFSNKISYDPATGSYTLTGQSISGSWQRQRANAAVKYHYFCTDGSTSCNESKAGYIHYFGDMITIHYLPMSGYKDIEDLKTAMNTNNHDSDVKTAIEGWFETNNLDDDDLEDAIFCNDRSLYSGALKGENENGYGILNYYSTVGRIFTQNADNNYEPSLDCGNKNDAFTMSDTTNGNGKLNHKIGMVTADELRMAGVVGGATADSYLYADQQMWWSMTPYRFYSSDQGASLVGWGADETDNPQDLDSFHAFLYKGIRPVVSLKSSATFTQNGADGTITNPYIVE